MNRTLTTLVFGLGAAASLWVAWRGADQLLQAFRIVPRLSDVSVSVWILLAVTFASVVLSLAFWFPAGLGGSAALNAVPFMDRMGVVFLASLALTVVVSLAGPAPQNPVGILDGVDFRPSRGFVAASALVVAILIALYTVFW